MSFRRKNVSGLADAPDLLAGYHPKAGMADEMLDAEGRPRPLVGVERFAFYELAKSSYAVIVSGERRFYGCIVLRKGVIGPDA